MPQASLRIQAALRSHASCRISSATSASKKISRQTSPIIDPMLQECVNRSNRGITTLINKLMPCTRASLTYVSHFFYIDIITNFYRTLASLGTGGNQTGMSQSRNDRNSRSTKRGTILFLCSCRARNVSRFSATTPYKMLSSPYRCV
jgi:hypothetical protein